MSQSKNAATYREAAQIETLDSIIKDHVMFAMRFYLGDKRRASAALGISLKTLYNYLHGWGVPLDYPISPAHGAEPIRLRCATTRHRKRLEGGNVSVHAECPTCTCWTEKPDAR